MKPVYCERARIRDGMISYRENVEAENIKEPPKIMPPEELAEYLHMSR